MKPREQTATEIVKQPEVDIESVLTAYAKVVNAIKGLNAEERKRVINAAVVTVE